MKYIMIIVILMSVVFASNYTNSISNVSNVSINYTTNNNTNVIVTKKAINAFFSDEAIAKIMSDDCSGQSLDMVLFDRACFFYRIGNYGTCIRVLQAASTVAATWDNAMRIKKMLNRVEKIAAY